MIYFSIFDSQGLLWIPRKISWFQRAKNNQEKLLYSLRILWKAPMSFKPNKFSSVKIIFMQKLLFYVVCERSTSSCYEFNMGCGEKYKINRGKLTRLNGRVFESFPNQTWKLYCNVEYEKGSLKFHLKPANIHAALLRNNNKKRKPQLCSWYFSESISTVK